MRVAGDTCRAVDAWEAFKAAARPTGRVEQDERSWRAGYLAAYHAGMAHKRTPQAPDGVDRLSYSSGAVEGAAAAARDRRAGIKTQSQPRELRPEEVISDVLEELLIPDPTAEAGRIVRRLRDSGFQISPAAAETPKTPRGE